MSVYSMTDARDNAELIEYAAMLGYFPAEASVLDATYGLGRFWTRFRPDRLTTNDLDVELATEFHDDFRKLNFGDGAFDVVVFDPPYGYRGTSRLASDKSYGLGEYLSTAERELLMADGLAECARVTAPGGRLLMKCQDQSVSAAKRFQTIMFANLGEEHGLELEDMLHLPGGRSQPEGKTQRHSWANYSTLLVFGKP